MGLCLLMLITYQILCCASTHHTALGQVDLIFDDYPREPVFGIEFTLDHVIASVSLANGSTYGLSRIQGGNAYQSLMRQYLETCHQAYLTKDPPWQDLRADFEKGSRTDLLRRENLATLDRHTLWDYLTIWFLQSVRQLPPGSVLHADELIGDHDGEVLSEAVADLNRSISYELRNRFNMTDTYLWPYANIVTPDFLWTNMKRGAQPEMISNDGGIWHSSLDSEPVWFVHLIRKFSTALHRNRYRLTEHTDWQNILSHSASLSATNPASTHILAHTKSEYCKRMVDDGYPTSTRCGVMTQSSNNLLIDFNNGTLSLWLEGPQVDWTPGNTYPDLGGHVLSNHAGRSNGSMNWDLVVEKVYALRDNIDSSDYIMVDLVLSGESWTEETRSSFRKTLRTNAADQAFGVYNIIYQPDLYAASKRAAYWARANLDVDVIDLAWLSDDDSIKYDEL